LAPRREHPVQLDLPPIRGAADITGAMAAITNAGGSGRSHTREANPCP